MVGRRLALLAAALGMAAAPPSAAAAEATGPPRLLRVPQDFLDVQDAIDDSRPGDLVLLDKGTYLGGFVVPAGKDGITIRGIDRTEVRLDGQDERASAIRVEADAVEIENMTAHNFTGTAFYWENVDGFAARYVTVYRVGGYGIYAVGSRNGLIIDSAVAGAARAAYYIGECDPCDTVVTGVTGRHSELGFSGTNSSGNLHVTDSLFEYNGSGIILSSFNEERYPPQRGATIEGNKLYRNGVEPTPSAGPLGGYIGIGIGIAGGRDNLVENNRVTEQETYGIVVFASAQTKGGRWAAAGNVVRGNIARLNQKGDLAIGTGSGEGNCFHANRARSTLPDGVQELFGCDGAPARAGGSFEVTGDLTLTLEQLFERRGVRPGYDQMPVGGPQPGLPGAADVAGLAPARVDSTDRTPLLWIALVIVAATGGGLVRSRPNRQENAPRT